MARRMLRDREDAADGVQTAWIRAVTALSRPGGFEERAQFATWMWSIVRQEALNHLRRVRVRRHLTDHVTGNEDEPWARGDAYSATEDQMVVAELLAVLPPGQRAAIELVWLRGLSSAEAADVLGVEVGTVKSRCSRAWAAMAAVVARGWADREHARSRAVRG